MSDGFAPPPPPVPTDSSSDGSGLSRGALAGLIAAVVIIVGAGFYYFSTEGDNSRRTTDSAPAGADSVPVSDDAGSSTTVGSATSTVGSPTSAAVPVTTVAPRLWDPSWTYADVPELTVSGIRGSGCGSGAGADVSIGDSYPDGVWFGQLGSYYDTDFPAGAYGPLNRWYADYLEIDGFCVYTGALGQQKYDESGCADGEIECFNSPNFWMENKNERFRTVPVSPDVLYEAGTNDYLTECTRDDRLGLNAAWRFNPVWIVVQNGVVTEIHADCYFTP